MIADFKMQNAVKWISHENPEKMYLYICILRNIICTYIYIYLHLSTCTAHVRLCPHNIFHAISIIKLKYLIVELRFIKTFRKGNLEQTLHKQKRTFS